MNQFCFVCLFALITELSPYPGLGSQVHASFKQGVPSEILAENADVLINDGMKHTFSLDISDTGLVSFSKLYTP